MFMIIPSSHELNQNRITEAGAEQRPATFEQNPMLAAAYGIIMIQFVDNNNSLSINNL